MDQFDVKEFARMFDAALASDNPSVKKALKNFMMVAAIVFSQDEDESIKGPFTEIFDRLERIERELVSVRKNTYTTTSEDYYKKLYGNNPTWVYNPNTSISTVSTTSAVPPNTSYTAVSITDIYELLKDINIK